LIGRHSDASIYLTGSPKQNDMKKIGSPLLGLAKEVALPLYYLVTPQYRELSREGSRQEKLPVKSHMKHKKLP
jgi:hypothetical protein